MPGLYIAIACILALIAAMEFGRRLLYRFDKQHWLTGTTFWFGLAWLVPGTTTLLMMRHTMDAVVWTVLLGLGQTMGMGVLSWIIHRVRFRGWSIIRSWMLVSISLFTGFFVIWNLSYFFGIPRDVLRLAFRGKDPLVFTVHEYSSEAWTDFTARMKIEFPPGALAQAVEGMVKDVGENGRIIYSWEIHDEDRFGVICSIETDPDHRFADITYMAD